FAGSKTGASESSDLAKIIFQEIIVETVFATPPTDCAARYWERWAINEYRVRAIEAVAGGKAVPKGERIGAAGGWSTGDAVGNSKDARIYGPNAETGRQLPADEA